MTSASPVTRKGVLGNVMERQPAKPVLQQQRKEEKWKEEERKEEERKEREKEQQQKRQQSEEKEKRKEEKQNKAEQQQQQQQQQQEQQQQQQEDSNSVVVPQSSAEFLSQLRELEGNTPAIHALAMAIKPSVMRQYLANQLETDHLLALAPALARESARPVAAFKRLRSALTARRADVVLQLLDARDRQVLVGHARDLGVRAAAKNAQSLPQAEIDRVLTLLDE